MKTKFKQTEIGKIPEDWEVKEFGQVSIQIIDGDRGKNYPKQGEIKKEGYCLFLDTKNVPGYKFNFQDCGFISREKDEVLRKGKLERGDIVLTTRGTVGNVALYDENVNFEHIRINSGMVIIRNDKDLFDTKFLHLLLRSPIIKNQFLSISTGSAQPQLPIRDLKKVNLVIPPISEQKAIAKILSSLDDKIELNERMNKTLEAIAQAIFKHWFIDFEFPRTLLEKGDNRGYKSSGGEMEYNEELGKEIPKGWKVRTMGDILELRYGKGLPERERKKGHFPVVGSNGVVGFHDSYLVNGPGIVIGRKGTLGAVHWIDENFFPIDTTFYVMPKINISSLCYLYFLLKGQEFLKMSSDSAVPGLNRNLAYAQLTVVPPTALINLFNESCEKIFDYACFSKKEMKILSQVRDALLPKLMSGKIRVKVDGHDVEEQT